VTKRNTKSSGPILLPASCDAGKKLRCRWPQLSAERTCFCRQTLLFWSLGDLAHSWATIWGASRNFIIIWYSRAIYFYFYFRLNWVSVLFKDILQTSDLFFCSFKLFDKSFVSSGIKVLLPIWKYYFEWRWN
jgi:hypothetical protein